MTQESQRPVFWTRTLWWAFGLLGLVWYWETQGVPRVRAGAEQGTLELVIAWLGAVVATAVVVLLVRFGDVGIVSMSRRIDQERTAPSELPTKGPGLAFPQGATLGVAIWLVAISVALTIALFPLLHPAVFAPALVCGPESPAGCQELRNLLVTMVAGGIGSVITTTFGYLKHATVDHDFEPSYVPWYVARPVIGVLLGVVFYFVLKGGLLATVGPADAADLNAYALAGLAALVGLFSKNAVEKLKEVFETLFTTRKEIVDEVRKTDTGGGTGPGAPDEE